MSREICLNQIFVQNVLKLPGCPGKYQGATDLWLMSDKTSFIYIEVHAVTSMSKTRGFTLLEVLQFQPAFLSWRLSY